MTTNKGISLIVLLFCVAPVFSQIGSRISPPEPFRIAPGSSFSAAGGMSNAGTSRATVAADFQDALNIVAQYHVGGRSLNSDSLTKSSIDSMLRILDPHSNYLDAAEFTELLGEHESEYSGTGSSISGFSRNGLVETYIVSTFPGSPAFKAGLRYGDRIVAVNGEKIAGKASDIVRDKVRGKRGSVVSMTIERADTAAVETISLRRERVSQPTIPNAYAVNKTTGYIDLSAGFSYTTSSEMDSVLRDLHRQGITSLILDLRGNGGGILDQAVAVAEKFLPAGTLIVTQRGRSALDDRTWRSDNKNPETLPLIVLVDEDSASASEVVAGALQDNDRALIVGEKTFGKGLVQSVLDLPHGAGLTLTTAKYFTPSGRSIQRDYSDGSLYNYFNHKQTAVEIDRSVVVSRTITNRKVYGGDGITPDEHVRPEKMTAQRISLIDPIFFFAREYVNGRVGRLAGQNAAAREDIRQSMIFGESPVSDSMLNLLREYVKREKGWTISDQAWSGEAAFIRSQLRYDLALAAFGIQAAHRTRTGDDPQVAKAIELFPRSAALAATAKRTQAKHPMQRHSR